MSKHWDELFKIAFCDQFFKFHLFNGTNSTSICCKRVPASCTVIQTFLTLWTKILKFVCNETEFLKKSDCEFVQSLCFCTRHLDYLLDALFKPNALCQNCLQRIIDVLSNYLPYSRHLALCKSTSNSKLLFEFSIKILGTIQANQLSAVGSRIYVSDFVGNVLFDCINKASCPIHDNALASINNNKSANNERSSIEDCGHEALGNDMKTVKKLVLLLLRACATAVHFTDAISILLALAFNIFFIFDL